MIYGSCLRCAVAIVPGVHTICDTCRGAVGFPLQTGSRPLTVISSTPTSMNGDQMSDTTDTNPGQREVTPITKNSGKAKAAKATKPKAAKAAKSVAKTNGSKRPSAVRPPRADAVGDKVCKTCNTNKPMQAFPTLSTPRKDGATRGDECRACRDAKAAAAKAAREAAAGNGATAKAKAKAAAKA